MSSRSSPRRRAARALRAALIAFTAAGAALAGSASAGTAAKAPTSIWAQANLRGGEIRSLAVHPEEPGLVLAGTGLGQVFLSRDGGESWAHAGSPFPLPGWVVSELVFDPDPTASPRRIWAALWGVWGGGTVVVSEDLGRTWRGRQEGLGGDQVYALAVVSGAPGRLYAATRSGVYGTTDGGESWRRLTGAHPEIEKVTSLLVDPARPGTVLAGTWRRVYRSDDGGRHWRGVFEGMALDSEVFAMDAVPGEPGRLWASTCGWVYRGDGWGERWTKFREGLDERRTPAFRVLPDGRLLAGTVAGLYVSADGGASWDLKTPDSLGVLAIALHRERPSRILLGTEGAGVWVSRDGGETFRPSNRGIAAVRVADLAEADGEVLAAVRAAGPYSGIYVSRDGGRTFPAGPYAVPTVLDLAVDRGRGSAPARVYAATEAGLYERGPKGWEPIRELGTARVEQVVAEGGRVVARAGGRLWERAQGTFRAMDYRHGAPRSLALSGAEVWVSDERGLYRLTAAANDRMTVPFAGGRVTSGGERLLFAGADGAWERDAEARVWRGLTSQPARALPTGHARFSTVLVVEDAELLLHDRETGDLLPLELALPARTVTSALVVGDRILLGTSGFGVLVRDLPAVK